MGSEGAGATRSGADFHNEDAFLVRDELGLYAVSDGASAGPAGETAASLAVAAVEDYVAGAPSGERPEEWLRGDGGERTVEAALRHAMRAVIEAQRIDPRLRGMATTLTLLLVRGERGVIGHVGDSRAYLVRRRRAHRLTADSDLTGALRDDLRPGERAQVFSVELEPSDRLLLCTDGAEAVAEDPTIARAAAELSPAVLASRIASAAHRRDASVDATVVAVRVAGDDERHALSLPSREGSFRHRLLERGGRGSGR